MRVGPMRMSRAGAIRLMLAALAALSAIEVAAAEPTSLPAFSLVALDGQTVTSDQVGDPGTWVLVYLSPRSTHSQALLKAIEDRKDGAGGRTVIVVEGSGEDARLLRDGHPGVGGAAWYADPDRQAFGRLRLRGVPTILGLRARQIRWTLQGSLGSKGASSLESWLGLPAH